jgi:iron only hydrogenase large subunit-like protein
MKKGGMNELERELDNGAKMVAMLAPCFVAQFDYPYILTQLRDLGFDKVVELTFGAKLVNHEYHKILEGAKGLMISSVCPGTVSTINAQFPKYVKNLIKVYSPMIVTAKMCRKIYPKHKVVFMAPCNFKKLEAETTGDVDIVIGMDELEELLKRRGIGKRKTKSRPEFDGFYNEYTRIYPLAGGLAKTAHLKGILKEGESISIDGIARVVKFLKNPDKKVKFLDANFCVGGCIGGPLVARGRSLGERKKRVLKYIERARREKIPGGRMGKIVKGEGIRTRI